MDFGRAGGRRVVADFDGGMVSCDAGALLLGETDAAANAYRKAVALRPNFAEAHSITVTVVVEPGPEEPGTLTP